MSEPTNDRKLEAVITTLIIMKSRLDDPWRHDTEECIKLLTQVREDIKETDNGNDEEGLRAGGECDQSTEGEDAG